MKRRLMIDFLIEKPFCVCFGKAQEDSLTAERGKPYRHHPNLSSDRDKAFAGLGGKGADELWMNLPK